LLDSDKLVLVDFYAHWCVPCRKMEPYLNSIAAEMDDKVKVVRINTDENRALCKILDIRSLPVLQLYKAEELIWENTGYTAEKDIRAQLQ
ncbi:MAG TPA: thioredoxin family protein, partial [Sphingobacterium sp.]|nr:thioredoxin family protein [Sphingobacterium sp.]